MRKTGKEKFLSNGKELNFTVNDFWGWSSSEFMNNALRGVLAEFIVAKAINDPSEFREEWDACDLITPNGIKVEVKSSSYIQSWQQKELSKIVFGIQPTYGWDATKNESSRTQQRQSDVYVFCVYAHKDQSSANPLELSQWEFYVLSTEALDAHCKNQKTISLSSLLKFNPIKAQFGELNAAINKTYG